MRANSCQFTYHKKVLQQVDCNYYGKQADLGYARNDKWSLSYWDNDFDGKWDSVGFHPDGEAKPSRYEDFKSYSQRVAKK